MKLNLDFQLKNLSGKDLPKLTDKNEVNDLHHAAKCLASALWMAAEKNLKFSIWSQELYKTGVFETDLSDLELLIAWIEIYGTDPQKPFIQWFSQVGIKSQIIDSLKKQKDKFEKK